MSSHKHLLETVDFQEGVDFSLFDSRVLIPLEGRNEVELYVEGKRFKTELCLSGTQEPLPVYGLALFYDGVIVPDILSKSDEESKYTYHIAFNDLEHAKIVKGELEQLLANNDSNQTIKEKLGIGLYCVLPEEKVILCNNDFGQLSKIKKYGKTFLRGTLNQNGFTQIKTLLGPKIVKEINYVNTHPIDVDINTTSPTTPITTSTTTSAKTLTTTSTKTLTTISTKSSRLHDISLRRFQELSLDELTGLYLLNDAKTFTGTMHSSTYKKRRGGLLWLSHVVSNEVYTFNINTGEISLSRNEPTLTTMRRFEPPSINPAFLKENLLNYTPLISGLKYND